MPCRAQNASMSAVVAGLPSGEPESDFCGIIIAIAGTATGASTAPTKCSRPFGASAPMYAGQFSGTFTVTRMKSSAPASFFTAASSFELTTWCAPSFFTSSALPADDENANTSHPHLFANCTARCPSPPMPTIPTRCVGRTSNCTNGLNTVTPPQNSGPAVAGSRPAGSGVTQPQWPRTVSANPPCRPTMVDSAVGHRL